MLWKDERDNPMEKHYQRHILIIEDDEFVRIGLSAHLKTLGYIISTAASSQEANKLMEQRVPDLVLVDIYLPDGSGLDLCYKLKARYKIPLIIITVESQMEMQITAVRDVAEYYFIKPLDTGKLGLLDVSIQRALNHYGGSPSDEYALQHLGPQVRLNLQQKWVERWQDGTWHRENLTPYEMILLPYFLRNAGRELTFDQLTNQLAMRDKKVNNEALRMVITKLRKKLEEHPEQPRFIVTVRGVGYRFVAPPPVSQTTTQT